MLRATAARKGSNSSLVNSSTRQLVNYQYNNISPAKPAHNIMRIGFIFSTRVPKKVAMKSAMLIQKCHGLMSGDEKFSFVISSKAAAASNPTTAGRKPINTLCTVGVCIYFINIRLINIISMSEGSTSAMVATTLPSTAMPPPKPALWAAV